jgi:hypothetical protein
VSRNNREAALKVNERDPDLSTGARYLLLFTGDLVGAGRKLEAGCDWLADKLGTSDSAVRRWRSELVEAGYLVPDRLVRGGQRSNTYQLNLTPREPNNPPDTKGTTLHPRRVTASTTLQQPSANPPNTEGVTLREPSGYGGEPEPNLTRTPTGDGGGGLQVAIAEAERDKKNGADIDPNKVGRWRYRQDPTKYDARAAHLEAHQDCDRCHGSGDVEEYAMGAGMVRYDCPGPAKVPEEEPA